MLVDTTPNAFSLQPGFQLSAISGKFTLQLRDEQQQTLGSLDGYFAGGWVLVSHLEVPEALRRRGTGTRLLRQLEEVASARNCATCHINMFEFSSRGFFEKLGYVALPADLYSQGEVARLYLEKKLSPEVLFKKELA
jgi:GNAT superfamily N-acetyltransferase